MKRTVGLILLLWGCSAVMAQARLEKSERYLGVHAGANASTVNFLPAVGAISAIDPQLGFDIGAAFRYVADRNVGVQIEVNFIQKGWKEGANNYTRQLSYIEIPFLTHVYFGKKLRGFVNFGPGISLLVSDTKMGREPAVLEKQYLSVDNVFDYGLMGGLGGMVHTSNAGAYQIEARFYYGLGTVFSNRKSAYFSTSTQMNLSLNLAWFWPIKK